MVARIPESVKAETEHYLYILQRLLNKWQNE